MMIRKYVKICSLLEKLGQPIPRLEQVQQIIQDPGFKYQKMPFSEILTDTLARSSYWLRTELFDESYLYQKDSKNLSTEVQLTHLKLLDIGCTLMDKGFPLEYHPEKYKEKGPDQLAGYVKTFVEQCHKRRNFLNGKITHRKKTNLSKNIGLKIKE